MGLDRPPTERLLAWLYTGPAGRLYGPLADIAALWTRWMLARVRALARRGISR